MTPRIARATSAIANRQGCAILNRRQPCAFAMLHPSLGSKGFLPDQSLQKGNGRDAFQRCDVLLFEGVESHRFLFQANSEASPSVPSHARRSHSRRTRRQTSLKSSRLRGRAVRRASRDAIESGALSFCNHQRFVNVLSFFAHAPIEHCRVRFSK